MRRVPAVGGLASTEFQMDLTNNNRVDVAFFKCRAVISAHTRNIEGSKYKAVRRTMRWGVQWDGAFCVRKK